MRRAYQYRLNVANRRSSKRWRGIALRVTCRCRTPSGQRQPCLLDDRTYVLRPLDAAAGLFSWPAWTRCATVVTSLDGEVVRHAKREPGRRIATFEVDRVTPWRRLRYQQLVTIRCRLARAWPRNAQQVV